MVKLKFVVCLIATLVAAVSFARPTGSELAQRIAKAAEEVTYVAVRRVTFRGPEGNPRVFDERVMRSRGRVYLSYFDGSPYADQKIWELKGKRYVYSISTNELRVTEAHGLDETLKFLRNRPSISGGGRVANRNTVRVSGSFGGDRGTQTLWIDTQKSVILKREISDSRGELISGYEVTEVTFDAKIANSKFLLPKNAKIVTVYDDLRRLAKESDLEPYRLNARGYKLQSVGKFQHRDMVILRQFYIKDSTKVSLFIFKGSNDRFANRGQVKIYRWKIGDHTLVLVGEMDEKELEKLARSIKS